ncbi:hypothetical protein HIM_04311 [Hirsutella minnesotensis 3608]|uniref:Vacuolar-sorting protein SNF8 n=1 Tax=Hirsutella minnesotensis 3608 TaxID=1043627 RepID=A0A0F8A603_9HYPO|nr:hypothetical protein HIM_04311 [Hirsutella minnesotensis 3608]
MSRKGVGIGAFDRSRLTSAHYASHGSSLRATNAQALETQLAVFRSLLQQFAQTHAKDIRSDPSFRAQFARMCSAIGVDPLASSSAAGSGRWAAATASVPRELSSDQAAVLEAAQVLGHVSVGMLRDNLGWEGARCRTVIDDLVAQGMLWVDKQTGGEWEFWSPSFMVDTDGSVVAEGAAG